MELGIKGHQTRGNEVIKILETLGGVNRYNVTGCLNKYFYYISKNYKDIESTYIGPDEIKGYEIFSLDDFLEKYPFKVGDRVRIPEYESEVRIDKMYWDGYEIQYEVFTDEVETYSAEELNQWNESNNKSKTNMNTTQESLLKKNSITISSLSYEDEVELNFSCEYELIERNGKHILIKKKPKYPKTSEECCDILKTTYVEWFGYYGEVLVPFQILIICRDAYWKIAGEELGLDKPWKPVWDESEDLYTVHTFNGEIRLSGTAHRNAILVFPTEEMRNAFYENFKDLIEYCKELL